MSMEPESNALEIRTEDGNLRKSIANTNVVDTKINLFGSTAKKASMAKSTV